MKDLLFRVYWRTRLTHRLLGKEDVFQPGDVYKKQDEWHVIRYANESPAGSKVEKSIAYRRRFRPQQLPWISRKKQNKLP